jgi:far upstream element-binding protein
MINRIIDDSGMGSGSNGGMDKGPGGGPVQGHDTTRLKEGEEAQQIMVPDRTVGLIIGRGGETIRDLQERSGCHINIVGESKSVNGLRPVNLIGTPAAAAYAKNLILEIVDSDSRSGGQAGDRPPNRTTEREGQFPSRGTGGGDKVNDSIYVPSEAVGMIIGKGGETIKDMQNQTGCKINVSQSSGPREVEREIGLVGTRDAIERAKIAIEEKVEAVVCSLIPGIPLGSSTCIYANAPAATEEFRWRRRRTTSSSPRL